MIIKFLKLFACTYVPVSVILLIFSYSKGQTVFLSFLIPWAVMTFSGLQNVIFTLLTFNKKFTLFYGVYVGGVVFRLLLVGAVTLIVLKFTNLIVYYYIIALSIFYILIQILEVYFISKTFKTKGKVKEN